MRITAKACAKINWSLDIIATRADGYHDMDMLMQPISLCDELIFENARWLSLTINGKQLPVGGKNLVIKAAHALNEYMGKRRGARIWLTKRIPVRAGLGGGSADCAATLVSLNKLWALNLPLDKLIQIGAEIGSDVPFCLRGEFARARGRGERLESLGGAPEIPLVLIMPGDGLSTAEVFSKYDAMNLSPLGLDMSALASALARGELYECARLSGNALEAPAIEILPEIGRAMRRLRELGAAFVRMTGSGSCVFGAFHDEAAARAAAAEIRGAMFAKSVP